MAYIDDSDIRRKTACQQIGDKVSSISQQSIYQAKYDLHMYL